MDTGSEPWEHQKSMISGPKIRKKIWEVSQVFFGEMGPSSKVQKSFSDGQGPKFQNILKFFFWDLGPITII